MKKLLAAALVLFASLAAAAPAVAAPLAASEMEFKVGRDCTANNGIPNATLVPREANGVNVQRMAVPLEGVLNGPCPHVSFSASARAAARAVIVSVRLSSEATVGIYGAVRWQRLSDGRHMSAGIGGATPQLVKGGVTHEFVEALPNEAVKTLSRLKPRHSLPVRITIRVTDLAGRVTKRVLRLRIHGRA